MKNRVRISVFYAAWSLACLVLASALVLGSAPVLAGDGILKVGSPWGPKTLDVQKSGYAFLRLGVVEPMVGVDENLKLTPLLAESWGVSPDKLTWTFVLRRGVRFHDGTALTADIMAANLRRLKEKGSLLKSVPITGIQAQGKDKVVIRTSEPFAPLPAYMSMGEASAMAPASFNAEGEVAKLIGTGAFVLEDCKIKRSATTRANADYWGPVKPKVKGVFYQAVPDAITRLAMLRAGELHIAQILPPSSIPALKADKNISVQEMSITRCRLAVFNMADGPFADQRVRQAVNYAVNRRDLVEYVLDGVGEVARTLFPPMVFWSDARLSGYSCDPAKAAMLLDEAGWKDTDGDGVRDKDGKPLAFKIVTYPERAALPPTAEVIQSELAKLGMKTELVVMQVDAAKKLRDSGDFGMYIVGRGLLFVPDPDYNLSIDYLSKNTVKPGWGAYHFNDPEVDKLLAQGRATFDIAERKAIYDRVQAILLKEAPMAYLNYYTNVDGVRSDVSGYAMHPNEHCFHLETVTLKD